MKKQSNINESGLNPEAQTFFNDVCHTFGIRDEAGKKVLLVACQALTQLREYETIVQRDGYTVKDRWGQWKNHPLLPYIRDTRQAFYAGIKTLNLELVHEIPKRIGRPAEWDVKISN
jgi:hypothetical protein